jgi:2-oxo-4-hydroxy-4-carboxy--5-ureidoimidazoline (OHCU) decarboxylase
VATTTSVDGRGGLDAVELPDGLDALDGGSAHDFVARMAPLFEGAPGFLWRLAAAGRPFGSAVRLFERARELAHALPEVLKVELVDAHPRLGAPPSSVSAMSFREQGYDAEAATALAHEAALDRDRVAAALDRLNRAYEWQFGFRYCVFVAGRSRAELLPGFEAALARERDSELHRALDAVVDIAIDRARKA